MKKLSHYGLFLILALALLPISTFACDGTKGTTPLYYLVLGVLFTSLVISVRKYYSFSKNKIIPTDALTYAKNVSKYFLLLLLAYIVWVLLFSLLTVSLCDIRLPLSPRSEFLNSVTLMISALIISLIIATFIFAKILIKRGSQNKKLVSCTLFLVIIYEILPFITFTITYLLAQTLPNESSLFIPSLPRHDF